nr:hypothetical protein [Tanacetum cinerariifolium]
MYILRGRKSVPGMNSRERKNGKKRTTLSSLLGSKGDNISVLEGKGIITWEHGTWKLEHGTSILYNVGTSIDKRPEVGNSNIS